MERGEDKMSWVRSGCRDMGHNAKRGVHWLSFEGDVGGGLSR